MLNVIMLSVVMLDIVRLNVNMLSVVMLDVVRLNVVMLSVVALGIRLGTLTLSIKTVTKSSFKKQTNIPKLTPNIGCAFNFKLGRFTQKKHCYCIT